MSQEDRRERGGTAQNSKNVVKQGTWLSHLKGMQTELNQGYVLGTSVPKAGYQICGNRTPSGIQPEITHVRIRCGAENLDTAQ